ncbi:hypothetical protein EYF80_034636 [Liparis tanakae]|uniref:VWFD domain-containing protein n=1 Tax=Liparis tanakae TaxID=230148 RepID=A0A4Z2GPH8_9TELE|nr:hypothetical protein EYF80_034636 [Liparis tanakae]
MGDLEKSGEERTYGSGVFKPFNGSNFYVRSNCPFTLTRFTNNRVGCDITVRRGDNGLLVQLEIIINKVRTVVQNGSVIVEEKRLESHPNTPSSRTVSLQKTAAAHKAKQ